METRQLGDSVTRQRSHFSRHCPSLIRADQITLGLPRRPIDSDAPTAHRTNAPYNAASNRPSTSVRLGSNCIMYTPTSRSFGSTQYVVAYAPPHANEPT